MSGPRVFDGKTWVNVEDIEAADKTAPLPPVSDGDGKIFVGIPSFRDGKRCAATLKSLFENAKEPEKIMVGLIEQNDAADRFCLEEYCSFYGLSNTIKRDTIRKDTVKVTAGDGRDKCPHYNQVRPLAFHNKAAKGPVFARAMTRKVLGNEEFCLQVDAHSKFVKNWDEIAKQEWLATGNEFAVLSTTPATASEFDEYQEGGKKVGQVPKQCLVSFLEQGIPYFHGPGEGHTAALEKPLLSHTWSAGFSFAKCHIEESAPYDPYSPYVMHAAQFTRFARLWTRGYDSYTPTKNIIYTEYRPQPEGHGVDEWFKKRRERHRQAAIKRMRTILQLPDGDSSKVAQANLGIYGLGSRRTLQQLEEFVGVDLKKKKGNREKRQCANFNWVPYDTSISPVENLFSNPDNLDAQPEYPLRTHLVYYKQELLEPPVVNILGNGTGLQMSSEQAAAAQKYPFPSSKILGTFWVLGLIFWYCVFGSRRSKRRRMRVKKDHGLKDV